jgi:alpha-ribazole phosphatase/probable phosphoglycerate mutase
MPEGSDQTTVILVRHGETEWNASGRTQGHGDSPLTTLGGEQGRRVAERLANEKIAAVYASTAGRARDTGELIAAPHGLAVQLVDDLRERSYGIYEGFTLAEIAAHDRAANRWLAHPSREELAPPGGETQPEMSRRVMAALREIVARHPGETVVIATHGGPIKSAVMHFLGLPMSHRRAFVISNGSLSVLSLGERAVLEMLNETCHLGASGADAEM